VARAEWTATVLEAAVYRALLQAWDFRPGSNFVLEMHDALRRSDRVIVLLSQPYLRSAFAAPRWAGAFVTVPQGQGRRLLPLRLRDCQPDGLLAAVVYVDLVGATEPEVRRRVLGLSPTARAVRRWRPFRAPAPLHSPGGPPPSGTCRPAEFLTEHRVHIFADRQRLRGRSTRFRMRQTVGHISCRADRWRQFGRGRFVLVPTKPGGRY